MKRGQAAFEFLTTYGWAFMVILIMIGALSYFGILNPSKLLPERCTFPANFACEDYQLNGQSENVKISLNQNLGESIILNNVTCEFDNGQEVVNTSISGDVWRPQNQLRVGCDIFGESWSDQVLISGQKEKVFVTVSYKKDSAGYSHYAEGEIYANVI